MPDSSGAFCTAWCAAVRSWKDLLFTPFSTAMIWFSFVGIPNTPLDSGTTLTGLDRDITGFIHAPFSHPRFVHIGSASVRPAARAMRSRLVRPSVRRNGTSWLTTINAPSYAARVWYVGAAQAHLGNRVCYDRSIIVRVSQYALTDVCKAA